MKNLKIVLLFIGLISFSSCSDDDGGSVDNGLIVGTWNITELEYTGTSSTEFEGDVITQDFNAVGNNFDAEVIFNADNTYQSSGSYDTVLTTTVFGETTTQTVPGEDFFGSGEYRIDGNRITFIDGDNEGAYDILELTDNKLLVAIKTEEVINQNGFTVTATIDGLMTMTR